MNYMSVFENIYLGEKVRLLAVTAASAIGGFFSPLTGMLAALLIAFTFNLWCGMRADGISVINCKRFSWRKFSQALTELVLYLAVNFLLFAILKECGDEKAAAGFSKTLTYVFIYVYLQNSFRNLIKSYPKNVGIRMVYHIIRLEFGRVDSKKLLEIIKRLFEQSEDETKNGNESD